MEPSLSFRPRMNDVQNLFQGRSQLPDCIAERVGRAGQSAIAPVGNTQFTPQLLALNRDELHATSKHLVAGKAGADDGYSKSGGYEALDHPYTGQFHPDL